MVLFSVIKETGGLGYILLNLQCVWFHEQSFIAALKFLCWWTDGRTERFYTCSAGVWTKV